MRYVVDSNCIARELALESAKRAIRRQRELDRERTFIFSEGLLTAQDRQGIEMPVVGPDGKEVLVRSAGTRGDSLREELADKALAFNAAIKESLKAALA